MSSLRRNTSFWRALPAMRKLTAALGLGLVLWPAPTKAAEPQATVTGRVVRGSDHSGLSRVTIVLRSLDADTGRRRETVTKTGVEGTFRFENLRARDSISYALEAEYDGGLFVGEQFRARPGERSTAPIEVWPTTSDPEAIEITADRIFLIAQGDRVSAVESVTIENTSGGAYIGRGGPGTEGDDPSPTLGFALPPAATMGRIEESTLPRIYATSAEYGFAATVAIPPGQTDVTFTYSLEGSAGRFDATRRALYPISELTVFAQEPLVVESDRLASEGKEEIAGQPYVQWSATEPLEAGDVVRILAVAEGGSSTGIARALAIALALIAVLLLGGGVLLRKRRHAAPATPAAQDDLVMAIAELDLRRDAGEISEAEWSERRTALKARIAETREPQRL